MSKKLIFFVMVMLFMILPMAMTMADSQDKGKNKNENKNILYQDAQESADNEITIIYKDEETCTTPVGTKTEKCDGSIVLTGTVTSCYTIIVEACPPKPE